MTLNTGTKLGRYEIRAKIGEGGMGEVYLAEDTELHRNVALKILPAEVAANQDRIRRFKQEAMAAAALNHPNIAHIYEIGESDGASLISMEFVDGLTLRQMIHDQRTDLSKLLRYLQHAAEGLAKAHAGGIVHRDLKPDNVMVTRDGHAKILDFGLAKLLEPAEISGSTSSQVATAILPQQSTPGTVMGTVGYMSPEQAQGRVHEIDHRSDIFSFGCILYEAITGRKAFEGKDAIDSLNKIIREQPKPISEFKADVPYDLQRIVRRCLAKDPEERYQTIKDVAIELKEVRRELQPDLGMDTTVPPSRAEASSSGQTNVTSTQSGIASTTSLGTASRTSSAEYIVSEIKRHKTGATLIIAALAVLAGGLIFGLYKLTSRNKVVAIPQATKITRLTNNGRVGSATVSPDGKYVAYSALDGSGQSSLWIRHIATTSNVQIVPPAGMDVNFGQTTFSPDGNYLYYIKAERGATGELYQVPVLGGTSKKLLDDVTRIGFSPDGKRFVFERRYASQGEDAIMIANADGTGEQKLATRRHPDFFLAGAAWSPDGKTIACPAGGFDGGYYRSVAVIQLSDGTQRPLTSHRWNDAQRVAWLSDGSGVITTANERQGEQYQIWYISYPEGEARTLTNDLSDYRNVSLTADSSALVAVLSDTTSNIWVAPYGEWNGARQLTSSKSNGGLGISWTPGGKIIYDSRASGNPDIWIVDADGRNQKQLTDDVYLERYPSVSPDGRYVAFDCTRSGNLQIWRMDVDGSNPKQLTSSPGFNTNFSPDGQWVVYTTFGPGGFSIRKVSIDGGEPVPVINKYALNPSVSPDGKLIACYYVDEKTRASKVALFPFAGGDPVKLFDPPLSTAPNNPPFRWLPDGRAFTYIRTRGGVSNIWVQPVDGGEPKQLTDFKTDRIFSFDFSRDGKQLALSRGVIDTDVVLMNLK